MSSGILDQVRLVLQINLVPTSSSSSSARAAISFAGNPMSPRPTGAAARELPYFAPRYKPVEQKY